MIVRPIRTSDFAELFALVARFATSFQPDEGAFEASARELIAKPDAWLQGAELQGRLVGYGLGFDHPALYANGRVSWLEELMVAEGQRRAGVGRALMQAFEAWARTRGSRLVGLATRRAARFYETLGYEESATYYRRLL
ncbi:MAG: GNAT family N-acetyltransferase [Myxococcota bacterium]